MSGWVPGQEHTGLTFANDFDEAREQAREYKVELPGQKDESVEDDV